ncbi:MAG TPA: hypothetical protein VKY85_04000 [Candidatus Angelobacter sp.]|nr:hypothetical protein [Candidatus Angelobacter sp.]
MSHNVAIEVDKLKKEVKEEFERIPFDPASLFSPREVKLDFAQLIPAHLPMRFKLFPVVENGNIRLDIRDVKFNCLPPHPVWKVRNATVNVDDAVSIVMEDNLLDMLVLTGSRDEANTRVTNTWEARVLGHYYKGSWTSERLNESNNFASRFSWTFLLDPGKDATEDDRTTVILEFVIFVGETGGFLQQVSSFSKGWRATNFDEQGGILFTLVNESDGETYRLTMGLFAGGLGALVCQGELNPVTNNLGSGEDGGTWTGTSGGPVSVPQVNQT